MTKPTMDNEHARQIAAASEAIHADEERLEEAQADVKAAKASLQTSLGRLRKLAAEIKEKGLFQHGER